MRYATKRSGAGRRRLYWGFGLLLLVLTDWRACQAMCFLEEPSAQDVAIEEKKRSLAAKHGLQMPDGDKSVMETLMERKKQQYEECIQRADKVLRQLGQERYETTTVSTGTFKRDKITGRMWFNGPDGEQEITLQR